MQSKKLVQEKIEILYKDNVKLYVVQLTHFYIKKKESREEIDYGNSMNSKMPR